MKLPTSPLSLKGHPNITEGKDKMPPFSRQPAASLSIVRRVFSENQRMYIQHMNPEKAIIFLQTGGRDTKQSSGG